jgi:hypothetical protein
MICNSKQHSGRYKIGCAYNHLAAEPVPGGGGAVLTGTDLTVSIFERRDRAGQRLAAPSQGERVARSGGARRAKGPEHCACQPISQGEPFTTAEQRRGVPPGQGEKPAKYSSQEVQRRQDLTARDQISTGADTVSKRPILKLFVNGLPLYA